MTRENIDNKQVEIINAVNNLFRVLGIDAYKIASIEQHRLGSEPIASWDDGVVEIIPLGEHKVIITYYE